MGKPAILFDNRLADGTLTASSTAAGDFDVGNLAEGREYAWWKPASMPAYAGVDSGRMTAADAIAVIGHDLGSQRCGIGVFTSDVPIGTNLVTAPEDFAGAAWGRVNVTCAAFPALQAPDGTGATDLLNETSANAAHYIICNLAVGNNANHTASIFGHAGTVRYIFITMQNKAEAAYSAMFDLLLGVVVSVSVGATAAIRPVGGLASLGQWFECSITYNSSAGGQAAPFFLVGTSPDGVTTSFAGNTGNYVFLWGARLRQSDALTPYIAQSGWMDLSQASWAARRNLIEYPESPLPGNGAWYKYVESATDIYRAAGVASPAYPDVPAHAVVCKVPGAVQRAVVAGWTQASGVIPEQTVVTCAASIKSIGAPVLQLYFVSAAPHYPAIDVNLTTGAVLSRPSGGEAALAYGVTYEGDGWWRVWAAFWSSAGTNGVGPGWSMMDSVGGGFFNGAIGQGFLIAAPKVEFGGSPTRYIAQSNPPLFGQYAKSHGQYRRVYVDGPAAPSLSVLMVGEALRLPTWLKSGFDPLGRRIDGQRNVSAAGHALGRVIVGESWKQRITLQRVQKAWIRSVWAPIWNAHLRSAPCVFAWDPESYPGEARLVTCGDDFDTPHESGDHCDLTFDLEGPA